MTKLNNNKRKNNERLRRMDSTWKRKGKEANPNELYFNGFSLKEKREPGNQVSLTKQDYIFTKNIKIVI